MAARSAAKHRELGQLRLGSDTHRAVHVRTPWVVPTFAGGGAAKRPVPSLVEAGYGAGRTCVTAAVSRTQQLVGQLRLAGRSVPMKDQTAIPDDVGRTLPLHRQKPWPRLRTLCAYLRGDV